MLPSHDSKILPPNIPFPSSRLPTESFDKYFAARSEQQFHRRAHYWPVTIGFSEKRVENNQASAIVLRAYLVRTNGE